MSANIFDIPGMGEAIECMVAAAEEEKGQKEAVLAGLAIFAESLAEECEEIELIIEDECECLLQEPHEWHVPRKVRVRGNFRTKAFYRPAKGRRRAREPT